ncbi:MAG: hypothetical protein J6C28_04755 [Bacilli bacterium]|nr:hypothetical protein [Bacilli bacterium]
MKKTYKSSLILIFLIIILTLYLVNSKLIINNFLDYTKLYIERLFPTSFIIYIISNLLINYQILEELSKITKSPNIFYIIVMSMLTGFPSGSKYITELYNKQLISDKAATYLLRFTHFPNPLFILGSLTKIISINKAIKIIISIYLANFIIAITTNTKEESTKLLNTNSLDFSASLKEGIKSSFNLQLLVYGTNIFFYLIAVIITNYLRISTYSYVLINGIFDLTKGLFTTILLPQKIRTIFILIFLNLGSLSIHIQTKSILSDTKLKYKIFLQGRIISTILSLLIFIIINNF